MESLDLAVRALFQEFQEVTLKRVQMEKTLKDEGTVTRKIVKGNEYWYRQRYIKGQALQEYIGPSTSEGCQKKIISLKENQKERRDRARQLMAQEKRRVPLLRRAKLPVLDALTASLIERFSQLQLLYKNGILIGSHAFSSYSGMLGYLFDKESLKTFDVDVVRDAYQKFPELSCGEIVHPKGFIAIRGKNFHSVPGLSKKSLPSSFVGPQGLRIDFLTPLRGKPRENIPLFNVPHVGAQPLHFLDFLIKDPVDTVLLGPRGGIAVTVPDPCRYAIHKLIVSTRRPITETTKRTKDISQASQLIIVCSEERPDDLKKYYREAIHRGKGWEKALSQSLHFLSPEVIEKLEGI